MSANEVTVAKRQKVENTNRLEWRITFDQTQGLRTLVEVVGNILTRVNFRITYDNKRETHFLCIDSIDPQHVCMIQARLICEKTVNLDQDVDFCVDSNILNLILKNIPTHYSIDLEKYKDTPDISIKSYETLSNSHHTQFDIPTLVDDSETMQLSDMSYKYTIEIDLGTLRQIVKMSMSLRSNQLDFTVKEPVDRNNGVSRTTFMIGSKGDASQAHSFHSATVAEGDNQDTYVIRAATDSTAPDGTADGTTQIVYNDAFSAQYLNFFLKSMERQIITMKLSQDKPLIVHYPLGADKSYICFVLAPKTAES
jgi:hypothetical protein